MWFIYTCICCYECNAIFLLFYALGCCFISVHKNNSYVIVIYVILSVNNNYISVQYTRFH